MAGCFIVFTKIIHFFHLLFLIICFIDIINYWCPLNVETNFIIKAEILVWNPAFFLSYLVRYRREGKRFFSHVGGRKEVEFYQYKA